jgi:hypothetical protein
VSETHDDSEARRLHPPGTLVQHLMVSLECDRPLAGSARFGLDGIEQSEILNTSQGDSGGPWWETVNGSPYVAAITHGYRSYVNLTSCPLSEEFTCYVNYGRWIDSTVNNFILQYSNL